MLALQIKTMGTYLLLLLTAIAAANAAITSTNQLTPDKKAKYEQFKQKMIGKVTNDLMKTDFYLLRWMEATNFTNDAAEKMLMRNLSWRKANKIENILAEDFSDIQKDFWANTETHDKEGQPIAFINIGQWPIREAIKHGKQRKLVRYVSKFQEAVVQDILKAHQVNEKVEGALVIADFKGFSEESHMCPTCVPVMLPFINGMDIHYPGFLSEIILINAPDKIETVMSKAKGVISEETIGAIRVFNEDKEDWMQYLDEIVDRDQRFENYGGTRTI